jgi:uncharacterized protein YqeY
MNLAQLQQEKLRLRISNPDRAAVAEMIVDVAQKAAKTASRAVVDDDLTDAVKKLIRENEKAIVLIESKNGDATKWKTELAILTSMLPPQMPEAQLIDLLKKIIDSLPEDQRNKKNQGVIMKQMKEYKNVDMGMVSKLLSTLLS